MASTLEHVAGLFNQWRTHREKRCSTPEHLIEQALSLVGRYKKVQITQQLGINNKTLDRWAQRNEPVNGPFIDMSAQSIGIDLPSPLSVTACLNSGATLTLNGEANHIVELVVALKQQGVL